MHCASNESGLSKVLVHLGLAILLLCTRHIVVIGGASVLAIPILRIACGPLRLPRGLCIWVVGTRLPGVGNDAHVIVLLHLRRGSTAGLRDCMVALGIDLGPRANWRLVHVVGGSRWDEPTRGGSGLTVIPSLDEEDEETNTDEDGNTTNNTANNGCNRRARRRGRVCVVTASVGSSSWRVTRLGAGG
jgi:hypothetical protein